MTEAAFLIFTTGLDEMAPSEVLLQKKHVWI